MDLRISGEINRTMHPANSRAFLNAVCRRGKCKPTDPLYSHYIGELTQVCTDITIMLFLHGWFSRGQMKLFCNSAYRHKLLQLNHMNRTVIKLAHLYIQSDQFKSWLVNTSTKMIISCWLRKMVMCEITGTYHIFRSHLPVKSVFFHALLTMMM